MNNQPFDHEDDEAQSRAPRTVDGHVLPIEVNLGTENAPQETPDDALALAFAEHLGVEPSQLTGFVSAIEYTTDEGITLTSAWSLGVPAWRLRACADELRKHLDQV